MAPLTIPPGSTISVRIIDTTSFVKVPIAPFMSPPLAGFTHLHAPAYSFLVEHSSGRKLLFDLGVRKDWRNMAKPVVDRIDESGFEVRVEKNTIDILEENGIEGKEIEAVIWSHWHWDHNGDPSTFPSSTALIVGPGFTKAFTPGYPDNPKAPINTSDYTGRTLREIDFSTDKPVTTIGDFPAYDYFGDGSFYLLDAPGHAIGHLCALARTSPSSFIFMGGDFAHHGGEFRPSAHLPIPASIVPNPLSLSAKKTSFAAASACPGHLFTSLNASRGRDETQTFFDIARAEDGSAIAFDADETERTIAKVQHWDVRDDVFVVFAHDESLLPILDFFPASAIEWKEKGWAREGKWAFLKDFAEGVEQNA